MGTGNYLNSTPAQIYITSNGGASWRLTQFANPNIRGQVTDIYFRDRLHGWATICEAAQTGWSGVYHSTDGGHTWARVKQAGFPVGVRETSRGVFYTDRDVDPGVMFSSDTGKTWTHVASTVTALGIDFMDDSTGFVTSQAFSAPHLYTTDGGVTWLSVATSSEVWTPYADPISRSFFLASERDQLTFTAQTTVVRVPVGVWNENKIKNYGDSGLTGGIAGSHVCQSVIYVQGREPAAIAPGGIIRTTDAGTTWKLIGGPNSINDKRFAVTGRGAVVIAFDDTGGVWRTTDGGDGMLSPSVLSFMTLSVPKDTIRTTLCDSVVIPIVFGYSACDSAQIVSVQVLNDSLNELTAPTFDNDFRFFSLARLDTLKLLYHPALQHTWVAHVQLGIQQADGYIEDTIIGIPLIAGPSPNNALVISGTTSPDTINFDSVSICSDAFHSFTLSNLGCGDIAVDSMQMGGLPFSIASIFKPFTLSSGNSRTFLVHYTPASPNTNRSVLYIANSIGKDSIILFGTGYSSGNAVSLSISDTIYSSACDSAQFSVTLHNIACKAFVIDSIITNVPFRASSVPPSDSLQPNGIDTLPFIFLPNKLGNDTGTIHLVISYAGTGRYDTIIPVIGTGTSGQPNFSVSHDSLNMGSIPVCSYASDTLMLFSSGCANVTVSAAFDAPNNFSLLRQPKPVLSTPGSDTLVVEYHPDNSIGRKTTNLIFITSAGTDTVPVSIVVTSGGGTVDYNITPNIQSYTCESQPFSISIMSGLCDSISIDSITLGGSNIDDFSLADSVPVELATGGQTIISGVFTPQDSLTRSANVTFIIHEADGTPHDTTIALLGQGIAVPPIQVALGVTNVSAGAGQNVTIPIEAIRGSTTNMSAFDFTLLCNTDLLSPLQTNTNGFFGTVPSVISVSRATDGSHRDTVHIHFDRNANAILPSGELCELICEAYVTSVTSTGITLRDVQFHDINGSIQCLPSETVPDTNATFVFNQACGDTTIEQVLATSKLILEGVSPNPTTGLIQITFQVPARLRQRCKLLEIYNELGEKLGERHDHFSCRYDRHTNDRSRSEEWNDNGQRNFISSHPNLVGIYYCEGDTI